MSEMNTEREAIETEAAAWLARRDRKFTSEEAVAFARWRRADPRHADAVAELELAWIALDELLLEKSQSTAGGAAAAPPASPRGPAREPHEFPSSPTRDGRKRSGWWWPAFGLAAAAVVVAVFWLGRTSALRQTVETARYETSVGGRRSIALTDGSILQLSTATVVSVSLGRSERRVILEHGEAFFRVARDVERPFIVSAGIAEARVLGTAFALRVSESETRLLVAQGEVRFGGIGLAGEKIHARQQAVMMRGDDLRPRVEVLTATELSRLLAWQTGRIEFINTPLREAALEFNRYHTQRLVVTGNAADVRIGGTFDADNLEGFLWSLDQSFDVVVVRRQANEISLGLRP